MYKIYSEYIGKFYSPHRGWTLWGTPFSYGDTAEILKVLEAQHLADWPHIVAIRLDPGDTAPTSMRASEFLKRDQGLREESSTLTITFSTAQMREAFVEWLSNSGEQEFMQDTGADAVFDYHSLGRIEVEGEYEED